MSGPTARPMPEQAAQALMAVVRSCGSVNVVVTIVRLVGRTAAPPTPMTAWAAMRAPELSERNASRLPRVKTTAPDTNTRRRPIRSPSVPADMTRLTTARL